MKIPEPRKLNSGTWFIQLRLGGVSVPVTAQSAKECRRAAELIKAEHRAGVKAFAQKEKKTLRHVVMSYISSREAVRSPSTISGYYAILNQRFLKYLDRDASKINYQQMINDELKLCSPKTVKNAWGLVRPALAAAKIPLPSVTLAAVPVKEIPFLQPEEILPFCAAVRGDSAEIGILLELQGLRRSEAKGLTWSDIDLSRNVIHVRKSLVQDKEGAFVEKDTLKNKASVRDVPIMIEQLKDALAAVPDKTGRVVTVAGNTMFRHTKKACQRAGVTAVGNHGLRHSFASLGYHLGLSERQLMELGGWSDYMTMHKIYIRLAASDRAAASNAITDFFKNANKNAN